MLRPVRSIMAITLISILLMSGCAASRPATSAGGAPLSHQDSSDTAFSAQPPGNVLFVKAVAAHTARVGTTKGIYRTADDGLHWQDVTPKGLEMPLRPELLSNHVVFIGAQTCLLWAMNASGTETFYRTTDAGRKWASASSVAPIATNAASFSDADHGWVLVQVGHAAGHEDVDVYRTSDGGLNWADVTQVRYEKDGNGLPSLGGKGSLGAESAYAAWIGYSVQGGKSISAYHTTDGGHSWQGQELPTIPGYSAGASILINPMFFPDNVWVWPTYLYDPPSATLAFYVSRDHGTTWTPTQPVSAGIFEFAVYRYSLPDSQHWWASFSTGNDQESGATKLYRSTDGGQNWQELNPKPSLTGLISLSFGSAEQGWAVLRRGNTSTLLQTADGGETWH